MGAKWRGLGGVGLFGRASADHPAVELGGFLDGGHIGRAYASESSSILTPHGQPLASCCLRLYRSIVAGQTAMMEGRLGSFLLFVAFLGFLPPSFVLARRLGGLACRLSLTWGAARSLLHRFVSAGEKTKHFEDEAQVTRRGTAAEGKKIYQTVKIRI